jgi:hypothetical protein
MMIKLNGFPSEEHDVAAALFFSKKHRRLTVGMEYTARVKSECKWDYVCAKEHIEGEEEERAFDEEDAWSRILTGSASADASQANSDKAAEKVNKLNAAGLKLKEKEAKKERAGGQKEERESAQGKEKNR